MSTHRLYIADRIRQRQAKTPECIHSDVFIWWEMVDSNHRRRCQQIYSLPPLATREISQDKPWTNSKPVPGYRWFCSPGCDRTTTYVLRIT